MTIQELENYEFNLIISDFKFLYESLMECLNNRVHFAICAGLFQFANMVVGESYKYMVKNNILMKADPSTSKLMRQLEDLRSKSIKMYSNANDSTLEKLIDFAENEYKKFLEFYNEEYTTGIKAKNYFIVYIDNKPISNYHLLTKKIFNFDIGTYNKDLLNQIDDYVKRYMTLIVSVLSIFESNTLNYNPSLSLDFNAKLSEYSLTKNYNDFDFCNTEILMAFLDISCVINFYTKVQSKFKIPCINDMRLKYLIFYNSILGVQSIKDYCDKRNISFQFSNELDKYLLENIWLKEYDMRNICGHYGCKNYMSYDDPIKGAFESQFKMNLDQINKILYKKLIELSDILEKIIFKAKIN